jgi:hypothetical protein
MQITLDKNTENTLLELANEMHIEVQTFIKNAINEQIEKIKQRKKEQLLDDLANRYKEAITARKNGVELPDAWKLLDEL